MTHVLKSDVQTARFDDATPVATPSDTSVSSSPPPAFPPPDPATSVRAAKTNRLLVLVALAGLTLGAIMTVLWLGSNGETDDALDERDLAIAERDTATDALTDTQTELEATDLALESTQTELDDALVELEAATNAPPEELAALQTQVDELEAIAADAASDNVRLQDELDAALAAAAEPADPEPTAFDATTTPGFARWVGELLSSSSGSSRLGEAASTCFGTEIINLIGVDAIGAGQNNVASGAQRQVVIDAMVDAAGTCGIDQNLIF